VLNIKIENPKPLTFATLPVKTICDADFDPGATSGSGTITYTSDNPAVATIVSGKIHIVGSGTAIITAADEITTAQQKLTVSSPAPPVVSIAPDHNSICMGMPITFTAAVTNAGKNLVYQWYFNDLKAGTNSATFTTASITKLDTVQCEVTNHDSCPVSSQSNKIAGINADPYVTPIISIASSTTGPVCAGTEITFTAMAGKRRKFRKQCACVYQ
jgi:hypothetical protein